MTDLSLLYGTEDNMGSNQNDNSDNMYSSQISGQQLHKLALNDMNNDNYSQNQQHQVSHNSQQHQQHNSQQIQSPPQNIMRQQINEEQKNNLIEYQRQQMMEQQNIIKQQNNANYQPQQNIQYQNNKNYRTNGDYNFIDRMNLKKAEVAKLALFSFVIVLGISIDRIITHYISKYVGDNVLTDIQEFLLRLSYPIAIFLLLWIFKAI